MNSESSSSSNKPFSSALIGFICPKSFPQTQSRIGITSVAQKHGTVHGERRCLGVRSPSRPPYLSQHPWIMQWRQAQWMCRRAAQEASLRRTPR